MMDWVALLGGCCISAGLWTQNLFKEPCLLPWPGNLWPWSSAARWLLHFSRTLNPNFIQRTVSHLCHVLHDVRVIGFLLSKNLHVEGGQLEAARQRPRQAHQRPQGQHSHDGTGCSPFCCLHTLLLIRQRAEKMRKYMNLSLRCNTRTPSMRHEYTET